MELEANAAPRGSTPFRTAALTAPAEAALWPRRTILWAAGALVVDLVFMGGYGCAMFGVLGVVLGLGPQALWLLLRGRGVEARATARHAAIWGLTAALACAVIRLDVSRAWTNQARVIAAVHAYHGAYGRYPDDLSQLVPAFLPSVPSARVFPLVFADFGYYADRGDALLHWTLIPPFGRPTYRFSARRHGYLD